MLSNATSQPKSIVELGYMCRRGLTGPIKQILHSQIKLKLSEEIVLEYISSPLSSSYFDINSASNYHFVK